MLGAVKGWFSGGDWVVRLYFTCALCVNVSGGIRDSVTPIDCVLLSFPARVSGIMNTLGSHAHAVSVAKTAT